MSLPEPLNGPAGEPVGTLDAGGPLETAMGPLPVGIVVVDGHGKVLRLNAEARRIFGESATPVERVDDYARVAGYKADGTRYAPAEWPVSRALLLREVVKAEDGMVERADGQRVWVRMTAAPLPGPDGAPRGAVASFLDITAQRRQQESQRFLAEASVLLSGTLDADAILDRLARLSVPAVADWCIVHTVRPSGEVGIAAVRTRDPDDEKRAKAEGAKMAAAPKGSRIAAVLATGRPEIVDLEGVLRDPLDDGARGRFLRAAKISAAMLVPLLGRTGVIGCLTFLSSRSKRAFDAESLALGVDLARRAALAVENARLFAESERSRALLDTVVQQMPVGLIFAEGATDRLALVNDYVRRIVGGDAGLARRTDLPALRAGATLVPFEQWPLARALRGETVAAEELEVTRANGEPAFVQITAAPVRDSAGAIVGSVAGIVDVTAQRRDRLELERATANLAAVITTSPLAMMLLDLEGRVHAWNRAAEQMYGWSAQEIVGRFLPAVSDEEHLAFVENLRQIGKGNVLDGIDAVRQRKDGSSFHARVWATPVRTSSGVQCFSIVADVTRQHVVEAERTQALRKEQEARQRAEEATRLKDEFLAVLSHEMRTPLAAILGWTRMLELRGEVPPSLERAFSAIDRNARAQLQMVEDLLDVSRIVSGRVRLALRELDLREVVQAAAETVAPAAAEKGVRLSVARAAGPVRFVGDGDRLQQVAWNLLSNAVKFTPGGGRVDVRVEARAEGVRLEIADTGAGIPREFLPHVFERFRQAQPALTRREGGLGLGLAIAHHLVELHGGTIRAESGGEGQGSLFTVELPHAAATDDRPQPKPAPQEPGSAAPTLKGRRILLVEDDPDARELVAMMLESFGAAVDVADHPDKGLAKLGEGRYDVLVSDVSMPGEDGYSFLRRVREAGHRLPAAALTANARREDRERALAAGFSEHVPKPVEPLELCRVLAALIPRS